MSGWIYTSHRIVGDRCGSFELGVIVVVVVVVVVGVIDNVVVVVDVVVNVVVVVVIDVGVNGYRENSRLTRSFSLFAHWMDQGN